MKPLAFRRNDAALLAVLLLVAGCDRAAISPTAPDLNPISGTAPVRAHAGISSRVLVDRGGTATIEFRSGPFNGSTNDHAPDGWFHKIEYKVFAFDGKNWKERLVRNVSVDEKITDLVKYAQVMPARNGETRIAVKPAGSDKKDAADVGLFPFGACVNSELRVVVEAQLHGLHGEPKLSDVVTDTADVLCSPDLDVRGDHPVQIGFGADPDNPDYFATGSDVKANTSTPFEVVFSNTGPGGFSLAAARVSCSARVFEVGADGSTGAEITPAGVPYKWSTRTGVVSGVPDGTAWTASAPIVIFANDRVGCRFMLSLPGAGSRKRIVVTANVLDPVDFDPSNNAVSTDFNVVSFTPVGQPPDGIATGVATEYALYNGTLFAPTSLVGVVQQTAVMSGLTAFLVSDAIRDQAFELTIRMGTAGARPSGSVDTTSVTPMTSATWSASVADLFAQGGQSGCLGSDQAGVLTQTLAANGGSQINKLCFELQPNNLVKLSVRYNWSASRTATPDAIAYREFLRFDVSLRFSGSVDVLGGAANMPLAHTFDDNFTFTFCPGDAEPCPATDPASYPPVKRVTQQISG